MVWTPLLLVLYISVTEIPQWLFKGQCLYILCIKEKMHTEFLQMYRCFERKYSCEITTNGFIRQTESILCQIHIKHKQQC